MNWSPCDGKRSLVGRRRSSSSVTDRRERLIIRACATQRRESPLEFRAYVSANPPKLRVADLILRTGWKFPECLIGGIVRISQ
jgi:hypothetical protein